MPSRPVPKPDADSAPYWAAAAAGRLVLQQCTECGTRRFYPRLLCGRCWSDRSDWVESAGAGTVYSFSVVHRAPWPALRSETPYVVALIDLDEGVRMFSSITGAPAAVRIGSRVGVGFRPVSDGVALPVFHLVAAGDPS